MKGFTSKMSTVLPACSGDANTNRSVKSRRGSSPGNLSIAALKWLDILAPCVDGFGKNDSATGARSPLCHTGVPSLVRDTGATAVRPRAREGPRGSTDPNGARSTSRAVRQASCRTAARLLACDLLPMESRVLGSGRQATMRGRAGECALLDDLVSAIRRAESRSLVIRGEAGIGKTALLEHVMELGSDLSVVRALGVESEMELAYASLHQLCAPLLDRLPTLPAPQREALEIVFGLSAGAPPDRFLVGLAVLSLFSEAADEQPLLCVVDDAQWLDHASALTLAFVARGVLGDPVGVVFAAREPGEELAHLPELEVRGLGNGDARALLGSAVGLKLDERVRDRIVVETRGNPLALLELPRGLTATQLAGGFGLLCAEGVPGRIEESFARRLGELSHDSPRLLLLLAAAGPLGDPLLFWRAAERLGITVSSINVETDGMLALGARVTFRHPLVRSAAYRTAAAEERRAVHLALAGETDGETDPDR